MYKPLIFVFALLALVIAACVFLCLLYIPVEHPTDLSYPGVVLHENGQMESCQVRLSGTLYTYRLHAQPPYFANKSISARQGLFVNDTRIIHSLQFGWYNPGDDCISLARNGSRLFTNRDMDYFILILRDGKETNQIVVSPASDLEEARAVLTAFLGDPSIKSHWSDSLAYLRTYLE